MTLTRAVTSVTPRTWGTSRSSSSRAAVDLAGDVDGGDGRVAAAEDPVLHVLDVEVRAAEPVEHLGEHADPVEVPDRQRGGAETAAARG